MSSELSKIQKEYLDGLMLGDGCLYKFTKNSNPQLSITRSYADNEYLSENMMMFSEYINMKKIRKYSVYDKRTNKKYFQCRFSSKNSSFFLNTYNQWYINNKKIVPKDLKLSPLICAIWFCDDGCIYKESKYLRIKLSTHGFSKKENKLLSEKLEGLLGESFRIYEDGGSFYIAGGHQAAAAFIFYIEEYIPKSMNRKVTWLKSDLNKTSLPHRKFRKNHHLNDKEVLILKTIYNDFKSPKEIAKDNSWLSNNKAPSFISRYLKIFFEEDLLDKKGTPHSNKNPVSYILNEKGKEKYSEYIL